MYTKLQARKAALDAVKRMSAEEREWASGAICDALSGIDEFKFCHKPFVFLGTDTEPNTEEIVGLLLMMERDVSVPRVEGRDMKAIRITPYSNFRTNKWGILEPVGRGVCPDPDLAIVPLVAFDGLNRVGHGGGYYDRYLAGRDIFKIGIAFECQRVEGVICEDFDIGLDMLVTEKRIISANGERKNIFGEDE